jgi:chromosome partitioning protein
VIIGVLNQKGGVAVNLAAVFATGGDRVLLVDADPQGSALAWSSAREINPIFPVVVSSSTARHG